MRIAFLVYKFPCLSETFILRQITGLLNRGHEVNIFASYSTPDSVTHQDIERFGLLKRTYYFNTPFSSRHKLFCVLQRCGLVAAHMRRHPALVLNSLNVAKFGKEAILLRTLYQIAPFLDKSPYDILHCQFGSLGHTGLVLRDTGVFKGKIITSFRGSDISSYVHSTGHNIYDDLFARGDLFLCVSSFIKDKLVKLGCDQRKIIVHKSGVDTYAYGSESRPAKRDGKVRILTIARLVEKKGIEYGIQAVAQILRSHPHAEYHIAGEGPLRDRLENLIKELRLGENIKILGWRTQEEITHLLSEADILLAPSVTSEAGDEEGIPNVIMEAFASGLPVVSTYYAGIPELVRDGQSGFLVPERDVGALAKRLEFLVEHPDLRTVMGENGRRFVKEQHDIEILNDRLVEIYQHLLCGELRPASAPLAVSAQLS